MLTVVTWLWGDKWPRKYVERLAAGVRRNLKQPHRFAVMTDAPFVSDQILSCEIPAEDRHLLTTPGCFARMRLFDRLWQEKHGIGASDRVVNMDVDIIVTGPLDPLFDRADEFTIMQGYNGTNPCPFNGSLWMFHGGERHDVWDDFSLDAYAALGVPFHAFPDDQGWLHHKFPNAAAYTPKDGVYAFKKIGWGVAGRRVLPEGARLVAFPGRDPQKYVECDWVAKNWGVPC